MIWITVLFALFLIGLIVLADMGKLHFLLRVMTSIPYGDKVAHFFLIGVLSFLVNRTAMQLFPRQSPQRMSVIVTLFLLAMFTIEEVSQAPISGRDASFADLVTNYAGIVFFALMAYKTGQKVKDMSVVKSVE